MGPFKYDVTRGWGEWFTQNNINREGVHANSDITTKKIMHKVLFFTCFWSAR